MREIFAFVMPAEAFSEKERDNLPGISVGDRVYKILMTCSQGVHSISDFECLEGSRVARLLEDGENGKTVYVPHPDGAFEDDSER